MRAATNFKIKTKQNFPTSYHVEVHGITARVSGFRPQTLKEKSMEMCGSIPARNESYCCCENEV